MNNETRKEEARIAHQPTMNGVRESVQIASEEIFDRFVLSLFGFTRYFGILAFDHFAIKHRFR